MKTSISTMGNLSVVSETILMCEHLMLYIQDCTTYVCVTIVCDIEQLTNDGVIIDVEFNIDERFFGALVRHC